MKWHSERSTVDEYKGHKIRVLARQGSPDAAWEAKVTVHEPDGSTRQIPDDDNVYPTLDIAIAAGIETGRKFVDNELR